jgi:hypothetical protein
MAIVLDGTTGITTPDLTDTSLTSGRVVYAGTSGNLTGSTALTFDGAILGVNGISVGRGGGAVASNTAVGASALATNSGAGAAFTALGQNALAQGSSGNYNTALGRNTLPVLTSGSNNLAVAEAALYVNTSGSYNTALGVSALANNTTASNNTAVGYQASYTSTLASGVTSIGYQANYSMTTSGNTYSTAVGYQAAKGGSGATNYDDVAVGAFALTSVTSGISNVAVGKQALQATTTGSQQTSVGYAAGFSSTTATRNVFVGYVTGYNSTTASANVAIGDNALYTKTTTGNDCVAIGTYAGYYMTTGSNNTFVGSASGQDVTTGSKNSILGRYNGNQGSLDIRTSSNYIVLSDGDGNPRLYSDASGRIRIGGVSGGNDIFRALQTTANSVATFENSNATPTGASVYFSGASPNNTTQDFLNCGDTTNAKLYIYSNGTVTNRTGTYNSFSDIKLKQDIVDAGSQWEDIKSVRVRKFRLKDDVLANPESKPLIGVIAQELELTSAGLVEDCIEREGQTTKAVKYSILYMKSVKALQEAMQRIEQLEARLDAANL